MPKKPPLPSHPDLRDSGQIQACYEGLLPAVRSNWVKRGFGEVEVQNAYHQAWINVLATQHYDATRGPFSTYFFAIFRNALFGGHTGPPSEELVDDNAIPALTAYPVALDPAVVNRLGRLRECVWNCMGSQSRLVLLMRLGLWLSPVPARKLTEQEAAAYAFVNDPNQPLGFADIEVALDGLRMADLDSKAKARLANKGRKAFFDARHALLVCSNHLGAILKDADYVWEAT